MAYQLKRRIEKLERSGAGDFGNKLGLLAAMFPGIDSKRIEAATRGHERYLNSLIDGKGRITWEGFCFVYERCQRESDAAILTGKIATDNAEDFKLGGRGQRTCVQEAIAPGPRPVSLKL
jgi:hypothetical protein